MTTILREVPPKTVADLLRDLGDIPPSRVRLQPPPGTATEKDLLRTDVCGEVPCELVDGTLVEKAVGFRESLLATALISFLRSFVRARNLGLVTAPDGGMRLFPGLVRMPDVAFVSWSRLPGGHVPREAYPGLAPDLAIEILSPGNTRAEMARKRREFFGAGVRVVWEIDTDERTAAVYHAPDSPSTVLRGADFLDAPEILPGFSLPLGDLFAELDLQADGS